MAGCALLAATVMRRATDKRRIETGAGSDPFEGGAGCGFFRPVTAERD
jgi:hypothetical protein